MAKSILPWSLVQSNKSDKSGHYLMKNFKKTFESITEKVTQHQNLLLERVNLCIMIAVSVCILHVLLSLFTLYRTTCNARAVAKISQATTYDLTQRVEVRGNDVNVPPQPRLARHNDLNLRRNELNNA